MYLDGDLASLASWVLVSSFTSVGGVVLVVGGGEEGERRKRERGEGDGWGHGWGIRVGALS